MIDPPPPPPTPSSPPPPDSPFGPEGPGFALGCLIVPIAFLVGGLVSAAVSGSVVPWIVGGSLLAIVVLVGRRLPGFFRGVAWFFAIAVVVFTACLAIIAGTGGLP